MENIRLAFQGIWSHKLRSILTMLGVIIGIASIITIVSTIQGTNEQIKQNIIGSGSNVVTVQLYQGESPYDLSWQGIPDGVTPIAESSRRALENLPGVDSVSFYLERESGEVLTETTSFYGNLWGIDDQYFAVCDYEVIYGRNFGHSDWDNYRRVVILDEKAAAALFPKEDPVGRTVQIQGQPFTVVGVVRSTSTFEPTISSYEDYQLYANTSTGTVYLPDSTWPAMFQFDEPQSVAVRADSTDDMTRAGQAVAEYLSKNQVEKYGQVDPNSGAALTDLSYRGEDLLEQARQLQQMSNSTNVQLIWIASISLLVGGIGVMNIMLVSVTERTSEIGLKKAMGARKRRIRRQFLTEAAVLTSLGGLVGVLAGIGLAAVLAHMNSLPLVISLPAVLIAVAFSTVIGLVFGLIPAVKAANLNPIDALRRD